MFASPLGAFFIVAYAFDRARAHSPKIVGHSLTLLLFVDVSPSSEFRRWPNQDGCMGMYGGGKNWRFSTEIAVYLGNSARWPMVTGER